MDAPYERHAIVVGVDGSEGALRAVRWAARAADRQQAVLRLLTAVDRAATHGACPDADAYAHCEDLATTVHDQLLTAQAMAQDIAPRVLVEHGCRCGTAASVLVSASANAELLVLGHRARGELQSRLSRSVAVPVAAHSACPVVIVRGRPQEDPTFVSAPVVVGVDGSSGSVAALGFAFDAAAARGVVLLAVHTWSDRGPPSPSLLFGDRWNRLGTRERQLLDERLAGGSVKYPQVQINRLTFQDRPAWVLTEQSRHAQLVVLGSRGRRIFLAPLLGSVNRTLLHHSECPVAIVRQ